MQRIQTKVTLTGSTRCGSGACAAGAQRAGRPIDGVRAVVKHRPLQVKGGDQDNSVTLRLAADNPQVVQGDVGADGTPQFSFPRNVDRGDRPQGRRG